jgi:hypothetical protein
MDHLYGSVFGLLWLSNDTLFTAVFNPQEPENQKIILSDPFGHSMISEVDGRYLSMTYMNGNVYLALAQKSNENDNGNRTVLICKGEVNNNGIVFSNVYAIN